MVGMHMTVSAFVPAKLRSGAAGMAVGAAEAMVLGVETYESTDCCAQRSVHFVANLLCSLDHSFSMQQ